MGGKRKQKLPEDRRNLVRNFVSKTDKQAELVSLIEEKEVVIAIGPSGSGKTYAAAAAALSLLDEGYDKIILIKSVTTIPGEAIGFIPGSANDKMEPFMLSFSGNIDKIAGKDATKNLIEKHIIEVLPLAYVRGLSIDDSIVIIDEAQNLTHHTFKTIMTRIGTNSKYIFLGDVEQIDRKIKTESCLADVLDIFSSEDYIGTVEFSDDDCIRNPIIPKILEKLREKGI